MITHKSEHLYIFWCILFTPREGTENVLKSCEKKLKGRTVMWNLQENWPKFCTWNANSLQKYATYFFSHIKYAKIWLQIESKAKHRCTIIFILVPLQGAKGWEDWIFIFYIQFVQLFLLWIRHPLKYYKIFSRWSKMIKNRIKKSISSACQHQFSYQI